VRAGNTGVRFGRTIPAQQIPSLQILPILRSLQMIDRIEACAAEYFVLEMEKLKEAEEDAAENG
jgi:hypothetical protein